MDNAAQVKRLLRQQAAIASFGSFALRQNDLQKVLMEAARVCADGLSVKFCNVCQYRPDEADLLIVAGYGWNAEVVGHVVNRRSKLTPCLVVARNGSARPGGAGRGCAAGASAGRFAV